MHRLSAFAVLLSLLESVCLSSSFSFRSNSFCESTPSSRSRTVMLGATTASSITSTNNPLPRVVPLPDPLCSTEPGTWAFDTMSRRVNREILERTWQDCMEDWTADGGESEDKYAKVKKRFQELRDELEEAATTKITYLDPLSAEDSESPERQKESHEWKALLKPFVEAGDTWLTAPWMVTEFYVYRRLMQALGYWDKQSPCYQYDPFYKQKLAGLLSSVGSAEAMLAKIPTLPAEGTKGIGIAASIALWGNKMDLSLWPADMNADAVDVFSGILAAASENLLHDDTDKLASLCQRLREKGGGNVDIIVDNAGFELVTDLALAQYLIDSGIAKKVTFQLKSHPTFVSDALEKDLLETVDHYQNALDPEQFPACNAAATKWKSFLENEQWVCVEDNFWVQPFAMWEMTEPLRTDMVNRCDLAFVKGDANYRRLLGDRPFDYSADSFEDVVGAYFPCPVTALRALKAEVGCGMDPEQVARAKSLDDQWLVNGRFGVVQFGTGASKE